MAPKVIFKTLGCQELPASVGAVMINPAYLLSIVYLPQHFIGHSPLDISYPEFTLLTFFTLMLGGNFHGGIPGTPLGRRMSMGTMHGKEVFIPEII